jgi:hypothetical protein
MVPIWTWVSPLCILGSCIIDHYLDSDRKRAREALVNGLDV